MHMADALLSPAVGGTMWAASSGTIAYCSAKVRKELDDRKVPLMGVMGAFLFAAQMINFSIPGTGSSGHLGGGLLLTILLGPYAAVLTGGVVSWFASGDPDGLEWAIAKMTGKEEFKGPEHGVHGMLAALQEKIAFLPDYSFRKTAEAKREGAPPGEEAKPEGEGKKEGGSKLGTSVSGIVGGLITLVLVFLTGFLLRKRSRAA